MFKKMSIRVQILLGFAVILIIMLVISTVSFTGVGDIVDDSVSMIEGESIKAKIKQLEIDHLNWLNTLSEYLSNPAIKKMTVQKDHKKCSLGKFLYGKERKHAEQIVPATAKLFKPMEGIHKQIHESASEIEFQMNKMNIGEMLTFFSDAEAELRVWNAKILDAVISQENALSVNLDHKKSDFGKWLNNGDADLFAKEFAAFAASVYKLKDIHTMLYKLGNIVSKKLNSGDYDQAMGFARGRLGAVLTRTVSDIKDMRTLVKEYEFGQKEAARILSSVTAVKQAELFDLMHKASGLVDKNMISQEQVLSSAGSLRQTVMTIGVISLFAGILLSIFLASRITKPIIKGAEFAKEVAGGNFKNQLPVDRNDEVGTLIKALNNIVETLGTMFRAISDDTDKLSDSSVALKTIAHDMSASSEQTSQKANLVAAASEEMNSNMTSVAAAMEQASTNVGIVAEAAEGMAVNIEQVVMDTGKALVITEDAVSVSKSVSEKMNELGKAALGIGKVTETIAEISDQTNLLALNATIEAARAGEAGKGFAVVANEIKELAGQTAEATKEIKIKIDGIQSSTSSTVKELDQVSKVINDVNQMVTSIAAVIDEQSNSTKEIASNVTEASAGLSEVSENIAQSSTVSGEIARDVADVNIAADEMTKSSSQVDASSQELNILAEKLKAHMERFQV